ncbi:plasminogen-binding group A streptococcal M-like protein PAM [Clinocottus analis]|uniref:plasminogen-binding group A streptococcal M-like protein PAM n=1 Tax=Clinocottus analis TaxID=304258 RepID=UPI0035BFA3C1
MLGSRRSSCPSCSSRLVHQSHDAEEECFISPPKNEDSLVKEAEQPPLSQEQQLSREGQRGFWEILLEVTQLKEELGNLQAASASLLQDRRRLQDATGNRAQALTRLTAQLDALKHPARDAPQRRLDGVSEEVLREALERERTGTSLLRSALARDQEELRRLSQENGSYARLAEQLSGQIVEMEEEISALREQLNSKPSEPDRLRAEAAPEPDLQDSEKRKMMQQLMELEKMVLDLEEVMDPACPHRFVEHETDSQTRTRFPDL